MNPEEMLSILKSLQEELASVESIHPDHRKSLQSLTHEIQQTLASDSPAKTVPSAASAATKTLSQRMKESVIEFMNELKHLVRTRSGSSGARKS